MKLKYDVTVTGIRPELLLAIMITSDVYRKHGHELVITSLLDGKHSQTSLHYSGCAFDARTTAAGISPTKVLEIANALGEALTNDFDVVIEGDHLHVEYQPRQP